MYIKMFLVLYFRHKLFSLGNYKLVGEGNGERKGGSKSRIYYTFHSCKNDYLIFIKYVVIDLLATVLGSWAC